ncbi:hypothetical protein QYF61_005312 [Mycteria americana]|uniref:Keratin n=1 Tax=Mycteria americana TaxID=33587 RepID=A0AAN7RLM5_MYCAM|nr:hypothetical protein QYF61_005312 [Mycteria americana]
MACYSPCLPAACGPTPLANSCNEPCVIRCADSSVAIQPSPVLVTLPGPILSSFPQSTAVGSTASAAVGSSLSAGSVPIASGGSLGLGGFGWGETKDPAYQYPEQAKLLLKFETCIFKALTSSRVHEPRLHQLVFEDPMEDTIENLAEVKADSIICSPLVYQASHFIVEVYQDPELHHLLVNAAKTAFVFHIPS